MDYDKLIEQYKQAADKWEKRHPVTDTFDLRVQDALRDAATAISTLQAENEKLRAELENYRKVHCAEGGCAAEKDRDAVLAKLGRVTAERDAAEKEITRLKAIMREKGIFTIPAKYPLEKPEWNW